MPYIGQTPFQEFTNLPTKDSFTGDGSTVAFDMNAKVPSGSENMLEVFIDNVRQEPGTGKAYTLGLDGSNDNKRITFSAAPPNGAAIYVINDKTNTTTVAPLQNDLNGTELILDGDADTSITADSDDRIDFKIANTDHFHITTSSGDTVIQNMGDAKDFKFNQYDGRTILEINDAGYVALENGATGSGELRIYEDTDNGSNYTGFKVGTQSANIDYILPTADGTSGYYLSTNASGVLSWANPSQQATFVATTAFVPDASDGASLGSASLEFSDLFLADGATIQFGDDQEVALTHVHNAGLKLNSTMQLQFNDASQFINAPSATVLDINATDEIELNATLVDINANADISGTLASGAITSSGIVTGTAFTAGSAVLAEAELELLDGLTAGTAIASKVVTTDANIDSTGMRNLTISGELDAATGDFSGAVDVAGAFTTGSTIAIPNDGNIGSAGDADAIAISSSGVVTFSQSPVFPDGSLALVDLDIDGATDIGAAVVDADLFIIDDGASGTNRKVTAARVKTYMGAEGGAFSLDNLDIDGSTDIGANLADADLFIVDDGAGGTNRKSAISRIATYIAGKTLTALTVDDVAINGKVITMTGSTDDTAVFTVAANGALTLETTDTAAAAANIQITADGTAEMAGTTVTLDSSGGITLDADNGTITFADAGSSLGTITSSGYSGTAAVATAVTITDNESTNENNAIVFTAGGDVDGGDLGLEADGTLTYNPSTGTLTCTNLVTSGTHTVTNSVEMTANSTVVFEGATADAHETTLGAIDATGDRAINLPNVAGTLPVLAAVSATAITSTPEELNILDGATVVVGEINALDLGSTAVGTAIASKAVILDSNKDYTGIRNLTLAGNVVIADDGNIGSASDADAMAIASNGVVTFSQIPVMPANSIDSDEYIDGSIDTAHIADAQITVAKMAANSVNSDQYVDGSIDTAHIADLQVTGAKLALDRRSAASSNDVYMGNTHDYIFADADVGLKFFTANGEDMRLLDDGTLHVDGDVIAFSSTISDERLKENIEVVDDALEKVEQLNGCTFTYKEDGRKSAGVIAQDVQKVLPCAVQSLDLPYQGEEDEDYLTVNYDSLNALLIESIKELSSKVKELEKKLEEK